MKRLKTFAELNEKFRFSGSCTSPLCGTVIPSLEKIGDLVQDQETPEDLIKIQAEVNKVQKLITDAIKAATPKQAEGSINWDVAPKAPIFVLNLAQRYPQHEKKYHDLWYKAANRQPVFSYGGAIAIFKTYAKRENLLLEEEMNEAFIGKKGIERVKQFLHKQVDEYAKIIDEMSDDASNDFFIQDFANWYKGKDE